MIHSKELAARLMEQVYDDDSNPEEFWAELGWDMEMVKDIAETGVEIGAGPNRSQVMASMQMGAVVALAGLKSKEIDESAPSHLRVAQ